MGSRFQILTLALAFALIPLTPDRALGEGPVRPVVLADGVINGHIPYLILPQVKCKDADLPGALEYFRKIALQESKNQLNVDCIRPSMCPKGDCGCKVCACGGR